MKQEVKNQIPQQPAAASNNPAVVEEVINDLIGRCSSTVFKDYLPYISQSFCVKPFESTIGPEESVAYFDITRLVIEEKDRIVEKLKNVYHLLAYSSNSLALIIHRTHDNCRIGFAVGKCQDSEAAIKLSESLRHALLGNFPGTACGDIRTYDDSGDCLFQMLNENSYFDKNDYSNHNSVAVVSNIASEFSQDYVNQGIEKIIDGIVPAENKEYTMVILGDALNNKMLEQKKNTLYNIYTKLSPFSKRTENWNLAQSESWGRNISGGLSIVVANAGLSSSQNKTESMSLGRSFEINQYNVTHTLEIIEKQMERLEKCEALGIWNVATYVFSPDCQIASEVAHMYMSLTQGNESFYEKPSINVWNSQLGNGISNEVKTIAKYVRRLIHPVFEYRPNEKTDNRIKYCPKMITPTTVVSGSELALAMYLPRKSVPGFSVIECAAFGREIVSYEKEYIGDVDIGRIHHMNRDEEKKVCLNKNSISSHVFVTGSTGSGKSNTVLTILDSLNTPFMVIEPVKGEYKYALNNVQVYGSNPKLSEVLRINPFAFNRSIHVYEHIDRLLDVFNVCWPMYAAMPAVLKDAIIKAYEACGWNLITSENDKGDIFPTFIDVCNEIDIIISNSDYSDENKGNYRGSLKTRLNSLTNGINQLVFCSGNLSDRDLFEQNTIIDLSRIGSNENKSLIMGLLVIRLQEYRIAEGYCSGLKHVTVLEEAHNLLRRTTSQSSEGGINVAGKSVEMLSNAIAEMRAYGEGFIIVDQSPSLLDMSVIRNTNTKLILRLPDQDDRELVGRSANLKDEQIRELSRLQRGVAAVYQNEWIEPVLCKINEHKTVTAPSFSKTTEILEENINARKYINSCVYDPQYIAKKSDTSFIDAIDEIKCSGAIKAMLIDFSRIPFADAQSLWQRLAFSYFNIQECVKELKESLPFEEWNNNILNQLKKYEFEDDVNLRNDSMEFYKFTQLMTFESISWMKETQVASLEKGVQLKNYMNEFRKAFFNS